MYIVEAHEAEGKIDLPLSEVSSELIQQFHRHWLQTCGDRLWPSRADIDPSNFKRLLPNVILLDIEYDPSRCAIGCAERR
jgi:PAS domain-containing protein